jgi:hypothetical protein
MLQEMFLVEPEGVWSITKLDKKLDALRLVPSQRAILEGNLHRDLFLSEVNIIVVGSIFCPPLFSPVQYSAPQKNLPTTNYS